MNREELLKVAKPILFNTEMVQAILDNRKTVTRRVVKPKYNNTHFMFRTDKYGTEFVEMQNQVEGETFGKNLDGSTWFKIVGYLVPKKPYKVGDILYVRETWQCFNPYSDKEYVYKATNDCSDVKNMNWLPSIHMSKEAARIFLKVTDVRVERLQKMSEEDAIKEGICDSEAGTDSPLERFTTLWDKTIKREDLNHSWQANPWVWVIEFERVEVKK